MLSVWQHAPAAHVRLEQQSAFTAHATPTAAQQVPDQLELQVSPPQHGVDEAQEDPAAPGQQTPFSQPPLQHSEAALHASPSFLQHFRFEQLPVQHS
jgi:hypothetical protein